MDEYPIFLINQGDDDDDDNSIHKNSHESITTNVKEKRKERKIIIDAHTGKLMYA